MTQVLKTVLFYEAITLPLKYPMQQLVDAWQPSFPRVRQIKDFPTSELKEHSRDVLIATSIACLASPIIEEGIFRGALPIIITYTTGCSEEISLLISAVAFSAIHYTNKKSITDIVFQFVDSYFLYNPLKISGGLTSTITAHAMHNLVQFLPVLKRTFF